MAALALVASLTSVAHADVASDMEELIEALPHRATDKDNPVLLHCAGGVRSGMARTRLRKLGYSKACNLGSYGRAASIVARKI